jgi:uncharacterized protein (TIGR00290 family)
MSQKRKMYFNWSSGKDAALALFHLQKDEQFQIDKLLTSINSHHNRVSMHGLRREVLVKQAEAVGIPLDLVELPEQPSMEDYNQEMTRVVKKLQAEGYSDSAFGDIFLEDLRHYREEQLKPFGIECHFPLWKRDTKELIREFINRGFRAVIICLNAQLLDKSFLGREIDEDFLADLPANVDPCGENGEFHTFCFDGPIFSEPVKFTLGEQVFKEYKSPTKVDENEVCGDGSMGFWFCDLE